MTCWCGSHQTEDLRNRNLCDVDPRDVLDFFLASIVIELPSLAADPWRPPVDAPLISHAGCGAAPVAAGGHAALRRENHPAPLTSGRLVISMVMTAVAAAPTPGADLLNSLLAS